MAVIGDKQEKKKDVGDCTRNCVGIIEAVLVQIPVKFLNRKALILCCWTTSTASPSCIFHVGESDMKKYQILERNLYKN